MYAAIGIVLFIALLILGRRMTLRRFASGTKFADVMRGAGLAPAPGGTHTYVAQRGGHFLTVRVMHQGVLATISCSATADLTTHRFAQRYVLADSKLQPESDPRDAATAAIDAIVAASAKPFRDAVGLAVGPGIVNVMVFGLTDGALSRSALQVLPAAEQLLGQVVAAYEANDHLPVISRASAVIDFAAALDTSDLELVQPDAQRVTSETGTVTERWEAQIEGDRLRVEFTPEFDRATLAWADANIDIAALDDDAAITFERGRGDHALTLSYEFHEHEESTIADVVAGVTAWLDGVTRLDIYPGALEMTVTAADPTALASAVNALVAPGRVLRTELAER